MSGSAGWAAHHRANASCLAPRKRASPTALWTTGAARTTAWRRQACAAAAAHLATGWGTTTGSACPQVSPGWARSGGQGGRGWARSRAPTREPRRSRPQGSVPSWLPAGFLPCGRPSSGEPEVAHLPNLRQQGWVRGEMEPTIPPSSLSSLLLILTFITF